jgi:hypothetical protein
MNLKVKFTYLLVIYWMLVAFLCLPYLPDILYLKNIYYEKIFLSWFYYFIILFSMYLTYESFGLKNFFISNILIKSKIGNFFAAEIVIKMIPTALFVFVVIKSFYLHNNNHVLLNSLTHEDGVYESLSAALLFAGGGYSIIQFLYNKESILNLSSIIQKLGAFSLLFLGIIMVWAGFEEISFFQRVLNVETPKYIAEINRQGELNFHNALGKHENVINILWKFSFGLFFALSLFIPGNIIERFFFLPRQNLAFFFPLVIFIDPDLSTSRDFVKAGAFLILCGWLFCGLKLLKENFSIAVIYFLSIFWGLYFVLFFLYDNQIISKLVRDTAWGELIEFLISVGLFSYVIGANQRLSRVIKFNFFGALK